MSGTYPRTALPIHVAPIAVTECMATRLDADGTRDGTSPLRQDPDSVRKHLEDLASDWDLANKNRSVTTMDAYGVHLLIERQIDLVHRGVELHNPTGFRLHVTVSQNHYHRLAKS